MQDTGLQLCVSLHSALQRANTRARDEGCASPQSPINLALAEKYYKLRFEELQQLILAEETAFKTILKEIEDIKAGKWDAQLKDNLGQGSTSQESVPSATLPTAPAESGGEESSDLSGVTETSSPSQTGEGSETPTLTKPADEATEEPQTAPEPPQMTAEASPERSTPTAPNTAGSVESEAEKEGMPADSSVVEDSIMADGTNVPADEADAEQPWREEEEEEEDAATKPEEEETDHEDKEPDAGPAQHVQSEERTPSVEHQAEEEEEEEEAKNAGEEPGEDEAKDKQSDEGEADEDEGKSPPAEEQEEQPSEETGQQAEEASDEEPAQVTRRSTRHRPTAPAAPVTRKTRRQTRASEPDVQSDAENVEGAETPQEEERASSPIQVEPIGPRRRKRKSSVPETVESPRDRKRHRDESEPLDEEEPGPSTGGRRRRGDRSEEQLALKKFQNVIGMLHSQISQHRNGNIFHNPIRTVEAPDYHDIVKRPMDLKTIKTRVKDGLITNSLEFQRDCFLMFANAMMYNRPGSDVYHMAEDMMHDSENYINAFRQTEGLVRNRP
ncbi:hypothetical protein NP233_g577 [Leucocoprinus birnbaumii]|uniref:Bromo domain-containing protein n=1 Tax=Leucocoprinus birnbaumii TaxID=56174 RepID=A0AAD5W5A5_9AGAR|nr:hypothetical protein NP233_g577 [Leucocoprinus birnbaumii]